jgi:hypothetical protein
MFSPEQVLLGLGIFFFILWLPLIVGFLIRKMRGHREPPRNDYPV